MRGRLAPVGVRPFGRLLTSYTLNELGDSVALVALSLLVFDRTGNTAATAGFFLAGKFLPALLAPACTARLDQAALRRALPGIYLSEAIAFALLAYLAHGHFLLIAMLALSLVDGTLAITGRGLTRGAVAAVLEPHGLLKEGNALMNVGFAASAVGGAALGGLLVAEFALSTALLVDAASFLVIAVLLATSRHLPEASVEHQPWRARLGDGLRFVRRHRPVRLLLGGQAVALVMFTLVVPIEVIYAKRSLGVSDASFGILLSSWGAGIVVGSLIYLAVRARSALWLIIVSTAAIGGSYLGMALAQTLLLACILSVVGGAGNGVQWIAVVTTLQERTPADYQARITGLLESLGAATPGIGYLLGGVLASLGSPRTAFAVAGTGVLVLVALAVLGRSRIAEPGTDGAARPAPDPRTVPPPDVVSPVPSALEGSARER